MGRYEIALGKKPVIKKRPIQTGQNSVIQTARGPGSVNLSINGPGGFRIIIPINYCNYSYTDGNLTLSDYGTLNLHLTGGLASQMAEDIESVRRPPSNFSGVYPQRTPGRLRRTIVS
jgi:hypothetical protein